MNKVVTSREEILEVSKKMILENGISSINIREVAKRCNVSVGSIYNYYNSKTDIILETIKSVWMEIFAKLEATEEFSSFTEVIIWMFNTIKSGDEKYPGFFTFHSLDFSDKVSGREKMNLYFNILKNKLLIVLNQDNNVKESRFDENLTKEKFVDYIFSLLISILLNTKDDYKPIIKLIENIIY